MNLRAFLDALYRILNYSRLPIASLTVDPDTSVIRMELISGEKYRITIEPTDEII